MNYSTHPANLSDDELLAQCQTERTRRGGPGGQHRNKVSSAIVLTHEPTGVRGEANERRSQHQNHAVALGRLRLQLALIVRSQERPSKPSRLWRERCASGTVRINPSHRDYPGLIAEAMDSLAESDWQLAAAADHLEVSSSQLIKLFKLEPIAFQYLNRERQQAGLHPLK